MIYGIAAVAALLLTAVLVGLLRAWALRVGLVDRPAGRKAHARPTPHLGGVAVAVGTVAVSSLAWWGDTPLGPDTGALLLAAGVVAALGLLDDLRPMGARTRLVVEACAAALVVHSAGFGLLLGALAVLWITFVTNAFNLLDNSDGAMGMVGAVTAFGLSICAAAESLYGLALVLCALAAALTGFLVHNWYPARIFLGDCGSLFTGFVVASAAVLVHTGHEPLTTAGSVFALSAVVAADSLLVVVSRRRAGRSVLIGGTDHIAHRLRRLGLTTPGAATVLGAASCVGVLIGLLQHRGTLGPSAALWVAGGVLAAVLGLLRVPVYTRQVHTQRLPGRPAATGTTVDVARG
ncbi:MraY family glycosyltransferase [Streptomyces sp. MZ04]|uniref:MraY family glycosyltransferase n=1 Tax=Streptomyces sp. MZ04 TaxID=2559236 RepID=UPI00107EDD22|nr:MraY family glycosyltransferase [Streptomyces sp. MZ04]TGB06994.1 undecaprenyl/decaprenyl-phosphate alpha-N-acetylglucosaminyl 1-phosphate transferase [Streptomyces sp. MZ04]